MNFRIAACLKEAFYLILLVGDQVSVIHKCPKVH